MMKGYIVAIIATVISLVLVAGSVLLNAGEVAITISLSLFSFSFVYFMIHHTLHWAYK